MFHRFNIRKILQSPQPWLYNLQEESENPYIQNTALKFNATKHNQVFFQLSVNLF